MIAGLRGIVTDIDSSHLTLEVGGVGYRVAVRAPEHFALGSECALHTHLAVKENALDLYGFEHRDELSMFELLLTIPKIGPKSAMQILTQANLELLASAIAKQDPAYLSKLSGISRKTAEKITTELKDKFAASDMGARATAGDGNTDLVDALIALGYSERIAREVIGQLTADSDDTNARLREALRILGS